MAGQHRVESIHFRLVDRQIVPLTHLNHAVRKPALILIREPRSRIQVALLVPVQVRAGLREVDQVRGEPLPLHGVCRAETTVVGLGPGDDVLDVRSVSAVKQAATVGAIVPALG